MTTELTTTGIATISTKPKRKYTKRKVKTTGRATRTRAIKGDPKTARAYMHRLGQHFDTEAKAVTALVQMNIDQKAFMGERFEVKTEAFLPSWRYRMIHWLAGDANTVRVYKK